MEKVNEMIEEAERARRRAEICLERAQQIRSEVQELIRDLHTILRLDS